MSFLSWVCCETSSVDSAYRVVRIVACSREIRKHAVSLQCVFEYVLSDVRDDEKSYRTKGIWIVVPDERPPFLLLISVAAGTEPIRVLKLLVLAPRSRGWLVKCKLELGMLLSPLLASWLGWWLGRKWVYERVLSEKCGSFLVQFNPGMARSWADEHGHQHGSPDLYPLFWGLMACLWRNFEPTTNKFVFLMLPSYLLELYISPIY